VERADWSRVAHEGLEIMNPIPAEKLDEAIGVLDLPAGATVLDLGCGKGDLLRRLADRYGVTGVGVDISADLLAEARRLAPEFELVEADASAYDPGRPFDLAASLGGPVTLEHLRVLAKPGGLVLLGGGYWRRAPSQEYLDALGATEDELTDYETLCRAGALVHAVTASAEDFDRYEGAWAENGERYAAAHPDEPGVDEFLGWIRNGRRRYLELGGRETLGFGLFVFRA
jgi:SAM-dependent methyltransferase